MGLLVVVPVYPSNILVLIEDGLCFIQKTLPALAVAGVAKSGRGRSVYSGLFSEHLHPPEVDFFQLIEMWR